RRRHTRFSRYWSSDVCSSDLTRTFSGTPSNGDIGTISVEVTADDGNATVSDTFDLLVQVAGGINTDPAIVNPIANQNATEDAARSEERRVGKEGRSRRTAET